MSLLDQLGGMLGGGVQGEAQSVPAALMGLLGGQEGGLAVIMQKFEDGGLGGVFRSWVGTGENQPVTPDALHNVLGSDIVQQLAAKTGLPVDQLMAQVAQHLPHVVDGVTPDGQLPQSGASLLAMGESLLKSKFGIG